MTSILRICALVLVVLPSQAQTVSNVPHSSEKVEQKPDGSATVRLEGVDIEFDAKGNWAKIYSTYTQAVDVPDRRGIQKAQVIAEEKGKAQIVRFLQQEVSSERLVEEVDATLQTATNTKGSASENGLSKTTQRTMKESVSEFTRSYARGSLRGVTVLETGYDSAAEEAWVKVGFSRSTMAIANGVRQTVDPGGDNVPAAPKQQGSGEVQTQPSEVRTGRQIPPE